MKKTILMAALVLMSTCCFAQKANLKRAKNLAMQETPDYRGAREAIREAIESDETKDLTETYFIAGLIGYTESEKMYMNKMMGQSIDDVAKGAAIMESFNYWTKANELAKRQMIDKKGNPMVDKQGNPVIDTKTRKQIAEKMLDYYQKQDFVVYGIYCNDQKDYETAYRAFMNHLAIPELDCMDAKMQAKMPKDSTYLQYKYYACLFAIQAELHNEAIALLESMKDGDYEAISINQFLYQEYVNVKDTTKFVGVLQDAIKRFPSEPWFLQNLINHYIFSGQEQAAIDYLAQAIEREPNVAQYHHIKGNLDENQKNFDAALADFDRALEIDPTLADAVAGKGRVYYNQAVKINEDAALIQDNKAYNKALADMNEMFKKSIPFFEKAHEMDPSNRDYLITLKTLYYRFQSKDPEMEKKYNAVMEELNK